MTGRSGYAKLARNAAKRFKKKCWWASGSDLEQQAWIAILEAERNFDLTVGVPLEGYAWRVIMKQLHGAVLRDSAPVSGPRHNEKVLAGLYRVAVDGEVATTFVDESPNPEEALGDRQREMLMHEMVEEVLLGCPGGDLARRVLLGGERPRDVACSEGTAPREVYSAARRARSRLAASYPLWLLLRE